MKKYRTIYQDKFGDEKSVFESNGSELSIWLRGIRFEGDCFESLEGKVDKEKFEYVEFQGEDERGDLTNCKFNIEFSIKLREQNLDRDDRLEAEIQIGDNKEYGVRLSFYSNNNKMVNSKKFGNFENALIDLQKQLPENMQLKTCLSCRFSHYHPIGNGMFGGLYCFKKIKEHVNEIKDKTSLFKVWDIAREENKVFNVQETFDCEKHQFITNEDWNYKNWK